MLNVKPVEWNMPLTKKLDAEIKEVFGESFQVKKTKHIDVMVQVYGPNGLTMWVSNRKLKNAKELGFSLRG